MVHNLIFGHQITFYLHFPPTSAQFTLEKYIQYACPQCTSGIKRCTNMITKRQNPLHFHVRWWRQTRSRQNPDTGVDHTDVTTCTNNTSSLERNWVGNMREHRSNNSLNCTVRFQIQFQRRLIKHDPEVWNTASVSCLRLSCFPQVVQHVRQPHAKSSTEFLVFPPTCK